MIPVLHLVWWAWGDFRLRRAGFGWKSRTTVALFAVLLLGIYGWIFASRFAGLGSSGSKPLLTLAYVWHMIVLPLSVLSIFIGAIAAVVAWTVRATRRGRAAPRKLTAEEATLDLSRRRFIAAAAVGAAPAIAGAASGRALSKLDEFRVRRLDVPLADLPSELEGLTIAHISDVHVGRFTSGGVLGKIADATNSLKPDLALLTGDLIDFSQSDLPAGLDMVKRMDARLGVFMCEGNHDLFEGRESFEKRVRKAGVPLLLNQSESVMVNGREVQLLGIRWGEPGGGRGAVQDANVLAIRPLLKPGAFPILLAHHPHAFDAASEAGIPLTLAGHTHGGQLMLSDDLGFGPMLYKYWSGLYTSGGKAAVVSNGVGNWFPLRTFAPAEIVHLTLRRA